MKIAFATNDSVHINAHFGWAKQLAVYEVSTEGYEFVNTLTFDGDLKEDGNEDKLVPKLEALSDCTIVYVSAIGGSAAARLIRKKVTPVKARSEEDLITDILNKLVQTLKGNPPPWLRKALQQKEKTFEDFEEE
ncbi:MULTISPECIES: nitrogen fixation protein NifX [Planktothrix]|uniref:Protein NifX n=2 Tax=Planktothrix TaxID=54304 RepID=A0A9W4G769_9CYAN|nr:MULTISPECIES: nitrogen fixation protein NifX [Planktothrix]MBD2484715.1 nitrogen fixation protein NifX [Planktothrix sp. FACHB-1365]MBE9141622.1 nitrogen fixation protein NifX [Planktothrix mougeotii LEGE 06226]CAD5951876.1 Protein NifX [Planktothrix pseudagardhii]